MGINCDPARYLRCYRVVRANVCVTANSELVFQRRFGRMCLIHRSVGHYERKDREYRNDRQRFNVRALN